MQNQISKNWQKVKLGEVVNVYGGGTPSTQNQSYWNGDIPWLTPAELTNYENRSIAGTASYITQSGLQNSSAKVMPENSVLLTSRATIGEVVINTVPMATNQGFINIEPKKVDREFFYYWLKNKRKYLNQIAIGSTFPELSKSVFKGIETDIPINIEEQKKIASILSAFDDKIEVNNKIAKTLEEMAQAIFKEWFVNFKFPGYEKVEFVDSELGKIPKGWEAKSVEELVRRVPIGKRFDTNTVKEKGSVPVLDQGKSGIIGYHDEKPDVEASETRPVIVFANHTCYQNLIMYPFSAIQNVIPFYPSERNYRNIYWLYLATFGLVKFNDYKGHWPEFASKKVLLPPEDLCERFGKVVKPMFISKYKIELENQKLAALRDLLLPKLMKGEIRV